MTPDQALTEAVIVEVKTIVYVDLDEEDNDNDDPPEML